MGNIKNYIMQWYREAFEVKVFIATIILIFVYCYFEISFNLTKRIEEMQFSLRILLFFIVYAVAYLFPFLWDRFLNQKSFHFMKREIVFLFIAVFIPALDSSIKISIDYVKSLAIPLEWLFFLKRCADNLIQSIILAFPVIIYYYFHERKWSSYGLKKKKLELKPYLFFLVIISVPLTVLSFQDDFRLIYPRFRPFQAEINSSFPMIWQIALFEALYGLAFIATELFYRGFLILAPAKFLGMKAVLPAASLYCLIHYQKPVMEIISSFLGGLILGIITAATGSVYGGIVVHLGMAWMMELVGNAQIWFYGDLLWEHLKKTLH